MIREKKVFWLTIEDIWFERQRFADSDMKIACLHSNSVLDKGEYDAVLVGQTMLLDISRDVEEIFKGFDQKSCRYPINKAQRDGVRVIKADSEKDYETYLEFENSFCREKGIPLVSMEEMKKLDVFYALSAEGEYLGGCAFIVCHEESIVRYKYGSTLHKLNANEAILWKAICHYHDAGIGMFDFGGVVPTEDRESYYYRHYHFKKKFGGDQADSYVYYKMTGFYRAVYRCFELFVRVFFGGNMNEAVNWINRRGMIG